MKYRVRLVRILMNLADSVATSNTTLLIRIILVAVITVTSVVTRTILAPCTYLIDITATRAVVVVRLLATLASERFIFPATFTP
jgi:hypothetical protein